MNREMIIFYENQMEAVRRDVHESKYESAFKALELAHIAGQESLSRHLKVHIWMLNIGFRKRDFREIVGQLLRIPLGILGNLIGIVPKGNTGGANVSAFKRMPLPEEIQRLAESCNKTH